MATGAAVVGWLSATAAVVAPILTVASLVYSFTQSVDEPAGLDAVNLAPVSTPGLSIAEPDLTTQLAAEEQQLAVASEQKDVQRRRQVLRQQAFGSSSIFTTSQQTAAPSITG